MVVVVAVGVSRWAVAMLLLVMLVVVVVVSWS